MSLRISALNIDCADPRSQAEFWSAALGVDIEYVGKHDAQITLGGEEVNATEEWASLKTGIPGFPRLVFAKVPEGKIVKNRVHLDFKADDRKAEVARLIGLGATIVQERTRPVPGRKTKQDDVWNVMQDPEGNEICVSVTS